MLAEHALDRRHFGHIARWGRSAVGVDVADVFRLDTGIAQGVGHAAGSAFARVGWRGHVVGVTAHAKADQLGVDGRTARLGMFQLFKHQRTGTVRQHEAVTAFVPRAAGTGRLIVAGRQRTRGTEAAHAQAASGHFGATSDHHVSFTVGDIARGHADAMGAGGAGGGDGVVRPLQAQVDRQETRDHVDDRARHEERRNAARP